MSDHIPPTNWREQRRKYQRFSGAERWDPHDRWYCIWVEAADTMTDGYHETRLAHDPRRGVVWESLWKYYFRHQIRADDCVLDLGCGYGDFINNVVARRRIAIDSWPGFIQQVDRQVEAIVGSVTDLDALPDESVDFAFAS